MPGERASNSGDGGIGVRDVGPGWEYAPLMSSRVFQSLSDFESDLNSLVRTKCNGQKP